MVFLKFRDLPLPLSRGWISDPLKIAARQLFLAEVTARFLKLHRLDYSEAGDTANRSTAIACWTLE
jgi:hypothetical protein